jgi:hypothetical protein
VWRVIVVWFVVAWMMASVPIAVTLWGAAAINRDKD